MEIFDDLNAIGNAVPEGGLVRGRSVLGGESVAGFLWVYCGLQEVYFRVLVGLRKGEYVNGSKTVLKLVYCQRIVRRCVQVGLKMDFL